MDSLCFANVTEVSWLKFKIKKSTTSFSKRREKNVGNGIHRQEPRAGLSPGLGKCLDSAVSQPSEGPGHVVCGTLFPRPAHCH